MMIFVIAAVIGLVGFAIYWFVFRNKDDEGAKEGGCDDLYKRFIDNEL